MVTSDTMSWRNRKGGMLRSLSVSLGRVIIGSSIWRVTAICGDARTRGVWSRCTRRERVDVVTHKDKYAKSKKLMANTFRIEQAKTWAGPLGNQLSCVPFSLLWVVVEDEIISVLISWL